MHLYFCAAVLLLLSLGAEGRITGFHVDDESCSGLLANNKTQQEIICAKYFASLANLSAQLANYSSQLPGPALTLTVDTGTAWSCPTGRAGCFNLTFNGSNKSVGEHVIDLTDEIVLMDYDRSPSSVIDRAEPFLRYADQVGTAVSVGLAIAGPLAPGSKAQDWQTRNESELASVMATSQPTLAKHASFKGFSVFTNGNWRHNSGASQQWWPQNTGVWYIDHELVLNETERATWLSWARQRKIGSVFIAPHAGNRALISIPGVEGSAADDAKFCDFIQQAHHIGIDIQLLSTPATDIAFIQNCSSQLPMPLERMRTQDIFIA